MVHFHSTNRFPELLPSKSLFYTHPFRFLKSYWHVYRLNEQERNREALAGMHKRADDLQRRREYREAHGIPETTGMAAWLGLGTMEEEARRKREEALQRERDAVRERSEVEEQERRESREAGREKRKVFFGIWSW
jgi:hypothetical protein